MIGGCGKMAPNPFLGVVFHWLGGFASGSFYVPYRFVKKWSWEVYWLVGGFFSWIIVPWLMAYFRTEGLFDVLSDAYKAAPGNIFWPYFWGAMWGFGGLTFGLTMRYLGMSLGMAVALGYCAAFGTIMPDIYHGTFISNVWETPSGRVILIGVLICLLGIAIAGMAGVSKEHEMPEEEKKSAIKEFNFWKGILVATFSGVMSACFAFGLDAAKPIADLSAKAGTVPLWTGLPKLCVVMLGGFTTNFIWCVLLNFKNRTGYQYLSPVLKATSPARENETIIETAIDAPSEETLERAPGGRASNGTDRVPLLSNYFFSALAGTTWYFQFFFYSMGETKMGEDYKFSSWPLHMASIIIFSSLWGIALKEWKGSSGFTKTLLAMALMTLIFSTIIIGYGNSLAPVFAALKK
jgi:L-rhamnose-H+ transport protein